MQVIDNMILLHNHDEQVTQVHDIRLTDYQAPLLKQNCQIDVSLLPQKIYISDQILPEELDDENQEDRIQKDDTMLLSKEYIEFNFQLKYTS